MSTKKKGTRASPPRRQRSKSILQLMRSGKIFVSVGIFLVCFGMCVGQIVDSITNLIISRKNQCGENCYSEERTVPLKREDEKRKNPTKDFIQLIISQLIRKVLGYSTSTIGSVLDGHLPFDHTDIIEQSALRG